MAFGIVVKDVQEQARGSLGSFGEVGAGHILMVSGLGASINPYQKTPSPRPASPSSMWKKSSGASAANTPRPPATASTVNTRAEAAVADASADATMVEKLKAGLTTAQNELDSTVAWRKRLDATASDLTTKTALLNDRAEVYQKATVKAARSYDEAKNSAQAGAATKEIGRASLRARQMTRGSLYGEAKVVKTTAMVIALKSAENLRSLGIAARKAALGAAGSGKVGSVSAQLEQAARYEQAALKVEESVKVMEKTQTLVELPQEVSAPAIKELEVAVTKLEKEDDEKVGWDDPEAGAVFFAGLGDLGFALNKATKDLRKKAAETKAKEQNKKLAEAKAKASAKTQADAKNQATSSMGLTIGSSVANATAKAVAAAGGKRDPWAAFPLGKAAKAAASASIEALKVSGDPYVEQIKELNKRWEGVATNVQGKSDSQIEAEFLAIKGDADAILTGGAAAAAAESQGTGLSTMAKVGIAAGALAVVGGTVFAATR